MLEPEEERQFRESLGVGDSGLDSLAAKSHELLNLVSFFTYGPKEVRAWSIPAGTPAVSAAGRIHSDMERGFIRAEVVAYEDLASCGSIAQCKKQGVFPPGRERVPCQRRRRNHFPVQRVSYAERQVSQVSPHSSDSGISLYVHVPFCLSKCPYCDFNTYQGIEPLMGPYAEALCTELALWGEVLSKPRVNTVFFGGGTPSYLGPELLGRIMETVSSSFELVYDAEVTIEANPGDLTPKPWLASSPSGRTGSASECRAWTTACLRCWAAATAQMRRWQPMQPPGSRVRPGQPGPDIRPPRPDVGAVAGHAGLGYRGRAGAPVFVRPDAGRGDAHAPVGPTRNAPRAGPGPGSGHV